MLELSAPVTLQLGESLLLELHQKQPKPFASDIFGLVCRQPMPKHCVSGRVLGAAPPNDIGDILTFSSLEKRDEETKEKLFAYFKSVAPETADARKQLADARKAKEDFEEPIPRCLISATNAEPRTVRILSRGNFLDESGQIVQPALPGYLTQAKETTEGRRLNRLDLANWLVSRQNPLTARVVMNRLWKQFFGVGLSKVVDDLGSQGEMPPNQPLLDWLASEFMDSGWDMKHMVRLIVNSYAYQQNASRAPRRNFRRATR